MKRKWYLKRGRPDLSSHKARFPPLLAYNQTELWYRKILDIFPQQGVPVSQGASRLHVEEGYLPNWGKGKEEKGVPLVLSLFYFYSNS